MNSTCHIRTRVTKLIFTIKYLSYFFLSFTIVYASATGHTEDIAERLKVLLPGSELKDLDRIDFTN